MLVHRRVLGIYHLHPFQPWFLAEDAHQMQLTRDSDSAGSDVVTADRFILCHSVLTMETWGGAWDLEHFGTNKHVIWTLQEYQTTFRIQDGFIYIYIRELDIAKDFGKPTAKHCKFECWLSTRQNLVVYVVLMLEDCVVVSHWEIRCSRLKGWLGLAMMHAKPARKKQDRMWFMNTTNRTNINNRHARRNLKANNQKQVHEATTAWDNRIA